MEYLVTLLWFLAVLWGAFVADRVWSQMLGRAYWIAIAPGIVVHEFSHVVACWITRAKVVSVQFVGPEGGRVEHEKPKLPLIGQPIISLAPLAGCSLALILVGAVLDSQAAKAIGPAPVRLTLTARGVGRFAAGAWGTVADLLQALRRAGYRQWQTYAFLYAALCFGIALRPSARDFGNAAGGIAFVIGVLAGADWLSGAFGRPHIMAEYVLPSIQFPLRYLISILGLVLLLTAAAWALRWLLHTLTAPRSAPPKQRQGRR